MRALAAALAGTIAGIHIDLWNAHGYRSIPTIGVLFLLNGIAGTILTLTSLTLPRRLLPWTWLATAGYGAATLAAVAISLEGHLFGFSETTGAPLLTPSLAAEVAAIVVGLAGGVWPLRGRLGEEFRPECQTVRHGRDGRSQDRPAPLSSRES